MKIDEAKKIIKELNLTPAMGIWHYSFNFEFFYNSMNFDGNCVYADRPINRWSPRPIFTSKKVDRIGIIKGRRPFWMCELTTFDEFLKRRSRISKRKSHFPTTWSFNKKHDLLKGKLITSPFNKKHFMEIFELYKNGMGLDLINSLYEANRGIPPDWIKMIELTAHDNIKGIAIIIDDGKSNSLWNLASVKDKNSWGLYMLSLWIKDCCERGIKFVDCGTTEERGYKNAFFMDAVGMF